MCEFKCKQGSILKRHLANIHDINVEWFCCNKCKYKCKIRCSLTQHRKSKHGVAASEKEPDNISKTTAPDKEAKISQNKNHHRKEDTSMIQETLFKENSEDTKHIGIC